MGYLDSGKQGIWRVMTNHKQVTCRGGMAGIGLGARPWQGAITFYCALAKLSDLFPKAAANAEPPHPTVAPA